MPAGAGVESSGIHCVSRRCTLCPSGDGVTDLRQLTVPVYLSPVGEPAPPIGDTNDCDLARFSPATGSGALPRPTTSTRIGTLVLPEYRWSNSATVRRLGLVHVEEPEL